MEVTAGYKQTEVGIIPEDWDARNLGDLFRLQHGFSFSSLFFSDTGPIVLTPGNFKLEGGLYFNQDNTKRYSGEYRKSLAFSKGDLLVVLTDLTPDCALLGKPAFIDIDEIILHNQRIGKVILQDKKVFLPFLYYVFLSKPYLSRLKETATGSTVRHTSSKSIYSVQVPLPTLSEQEAIAEALSDADALIEALEQLIAKKRQVKQGAMQELLTGKRRLLGFSGEWVIREIGDLGLDISDRNYSSMYPKQSDFKEMGVPFIRANNISKMKVIDDDMRFISADQHNVLLKGHLKKGDILITTRGELGNIALVPDRHIGSNINAQIVRINTRQLINHIYLAFFLSHDDVQKKIKGAETGSALKQLPVGKLVKIPVALPTLPEQTAIAEILSDMDLEIAALEGKLSKARQVKQGMMSVLLTGRIRLT